MFRPSVVERAGMAQKSCCTHGYSTPCPGADVTGKGSENPRITMTKPREKP